MFFLFHVILFHLNIMIAYRFKSRKRRESTRLDINTLVLFLDYHWSESRVKTQQYR